MQCSTTRKEKPSTRSKPERKHQKSSDLAPKGQRQKRGTNRGQLFITALHWKWDEEWVAIPDVIPPPSVVLWMRTGRSRGGQSSVRSFRVFRNYEDTRPSGRRRPPFSWYLLVFNYHPSIYGFPPDSTVPTHLLYFIIRPPFHRIPKLFRDLWSPSLSYVLQNFNHFFNSLTTRRFEINRWIFIYSCIASSNQRYQDLIIISYHYSLHVCCLPTVSLYYHYIDWCRNCFSFPASVLPLFLFHRNVDCFCPYLDALVFPTLESSSCVISEMRL